MVNISDIPLYTPGRWLCHTAIFISALTVSTLRQKRVSNRADLEITTCLLEKITIQMPFL